MHVLVRGGGEPLPNVVHSAGDGADGERAVAQPRQRMIVHLFLLGVLGYVAHKTRPPRDSFQKYFESSSGTRSRFLGGLVERLLGGRSAPSFQFIDLVLFWLVRVQETQQLFLGVFGLWIPVSLPPSDEPPPPILMGALRGGQGSRADERERQKEREEEAALAAQRSEANALKSSGKYIEAAVSFEKGAQLSLRSDVYSAGELFEEAAKCYKMAKSRDEYARAGLRAADLFIKKGRFVRAAGLYEKVAKYIVSAVGAEEGALGYLRRAAELYAMEDDSRGEGVLLDLAHLHAGMGRFAAAGPVFERQAQDIYRRDPILVNQSQRLLLFSLLCALELDQAVFLRKAAELLGRHSWFASCREGKWVALLAQLLSDVQAADFAVEESISVLDQDLGMMASMPPWLGSLWDRRRATLLATPPDLT